MTGNPLSMVVLLGGLAMLPFFLMMVTSFVKIAVVLSILRTAIGVQQAPPNQVITGLAMVLSVFVMAPVATEAWDAAQPYMAQLETLQDANASQLDTFQTMAHETSAPLKRFLLKHADDDERALLLELAQELQTEEARAGMKDDDLMIVIPAFMLTELEEAFTIGFILFVPFLLVDLVVANILLSLGMHMLSPTTVSLPFKLLLFVLVDGWYLVVRGLLLGYA